MSSVKGWLRQPTNIAEYLFSTNKRDGDIIEKLSVSQFEKWRASTNTTPLFKVLKGFLKRELQGHHSVGYFYAPKCMQWGITQASMSLSDDAFNPRCASVYNTKCAIAECLQCAENGGFTRVRNCSYPQVKAVITFQLFLSAQANFIPKLITSQLAGVPDGGNATNCLDTCGPCLDADADGLAKNPWQQTVARLHDTPSSNEATMVIHGRGLSKELTR